MTETVTVYYAPRTRAFVALWLVEELKIDYRLESFDIMTGRHRRPDYLALNPMGKVPLVVDGGQPVHETGAIALHLADRYREVPLAPSIGDPQRGRYLSWLFFAGNVIEPAYCEKAFGWQVNDGTVGWGSYDRMVAALTPVVEQGPWLLGDRFTAADLVIGNYLHSGTKFGVIEPDSALGRFAARAIDRPAFARAAEIEARESARFPAQ